ncbi:Uncharacterised protein [uncultured archaeon]|nr:Uncharacterised protein [uncultured archaeon]
MDSIGLIGIDISLILAGICAFYAYRCVMLLTDTNIIGVGIELAKNRSFLSMNFMFIMIIGALSGLQVVLGLVEQLNLISISYTHNVIYMIYYLDLSGAMFALLLLTIAWYKLLLKVNTWDTRWIKDQRRLKIQKPYK